MTNALDNTNAAAQAQCRLARLARRGVAMCLLACTGVGAAHAQYHGRRDDAQLTPPPSARAERVPAPQIELPREQPRYYDQQRAYEEARRQATQVQGEGSREGGRRGGRLTPDERRDLRRQINEAGADIYPNAQRR